MPLLSADQTAPARDFKAIVADTDMIGCRAIYIGGDGNLVLMGNDRTTATFVGLLAGTVLPCSPKRVVAAGTTATNLVGLY